MKFVVAFSTSVLCLGTMSLSSSLVLEGIQASRPLANLDPLTTYALSQADLDAGRWIKEHIPLDSVMATNRLCSLPTDKAPFCFSTVFPISAIGQRQALIEGTTFGVSFNLAAEGSDYKWAVDRLTESANFGARPDRKTATYLWSQGVRYYWVDRSIANASYGEPFATSVYSNNRAIILRLNNPYARSG
jgi:hypothetical protein